jgi:hypothetical protein
MEQDNDWQASPKKTTPLKERLEKITENLRAKPRRAVKKADLELLQAYKIGKAENPKVMTTQPIETPWRISEREKVWTECFNWLQKQADVQITEVSVRSYVCHFIRDGKFLKLYLPYEDTKLQTVLGSEVSSNWVEFNDLKAFKQALKQFNKTE